VALALTDPNAATLAVVLLMGNEDLPCRLPRIGTHIRAALARPPEMAPAFATVATVLPGSVVARQPCLSAPWLSRNLSGDSAPGRRGCGVGYRSQPCWHLLSVRTPRQAIRPVQSDVQVQAAATCPDKLS
jgi:hypothetical protein